jgi:hypothetical protein
MPHTFLLLHETSPKAVLTNYCVSPREETFYCTATNRPSGKIPVADANTALRRDAE